jgi:hypothetical protein
MPIVPGDTGRPFEPDRRWKLYMQGVLTQTEFAFAVLDDLGGDDIEGQVRSMPTAMREALATFLRVYPIEEIPPGLFIPGTGITPEFNRRWQAYRQEKAREVLRVLAPRPPATGA